MRRVALLVLLVVAAGGVSRAEEPVPPAAPPPWPGPPPKFVLRGPQPAKVRLLRPVVAQIPGPQFGGGEIVVADRRMTQRMEKAKEALEAERFEEAVALLQIVLDRGEDSFFHPDGEPESLYRSLRDEASRLVGTMPEAARREFYEAEHGATARRELAKAVEASDPTGFAEVARRYLHTEAGAEAQYRLATWHLDRGLSQSAVAAFDRLADHPATARFEPMLSLRRIAALVAAGQTDRAGTLAKGLRESHPRLAVRLGGDVRSFDPGGAPFLAAIDNRLGTRRPGLAVADDWATRLGGPTRGGFVTLESGGDGKVWSRSTVVDPFREDPTETAPTDLTRTFTKAVNRFAGSAGVPAMQPIVVGDRVVVRTYANVGVLDRDDGEMRFGTIYDSAFDDLGFTEAGANDNVLSGYVLQRGWWDGTQGTFSSDGELLYSVEDAGPSTGIPVPGRPFTLPGKSSRLAAYDLESGRLRWQVGGEPGDFAAPMAGTYFLGAPLPLGGQLFCLAEAENEVRLLVLDPRTGGLRPGVEEAWSQPLVAPNVDLTRDPIRRSTGLSVTYGDGILVCPTGVGVYVGIDLAARTLAWARKFDPPKNGRPPFPVPVPNPNPNANRSGWLDDVVVVEGGRALLTPRYSNALHCIDLRTGKDVWEKPLPREDGLVLLGVADGTAVVLGKQKLRAVGMKDGKPTWEAPVELGSPAGRGFLADGLAVVPLDSNQIAFVSLANGKLAKIDAPEGTELGNLVPAGDRVVSQSAGTVSAFPLEIPTVGEVSEPTP